MGERRAAARPGGAWWSGALAAALALAAWGAAPPPVPQLSAAQVQRLNAAGALLGKSPGSGELEALRRDSAASTSPPAALAATVLYRTDGGKHEKRLMELFAVDDYAARSRGRYTMITQADMAKIVAEIERRYGPSLTDRRVLLLLIFWHYRERNEWVMRGEQRLSLARFFRTAFLTAAFQGSGIDAVELANRIDQNTQKSGASK